MENNSISKMNIRRKKSLPCIQHVMGYCIKGFYKGFLQTGMKKIENRRTNPKGG